MGKKHSLRKILKTRLPSVETLKKEGRWFTYKEQQELRALRDQLETVLTKIDNNQPLLPEEKVLFEQHGEDGIESLYMEVEDDYRKKLAGRAIHRLAAFHEYINPTEIPAAHQLYLCRRLEALERGEIKVLLISMGAGLAKSSYTSRSFVQWILGRHPDWKILAGGYNLSFVTNEFSKRNRAVVSSPEFRDIFPDIEIDPDYKAANLWVIDRYGGRYNVRSAGADTSGIRADLILLDDILGGAKSAFSPVERDSVWTWITNDVFPRRLPNARICMIGTRWHTADPLGRTEALLEENPHALPEPVEVINIPTTGNKSNPFADEGHYVWEDFYGKEHFETQKAILDTETWTAMYEGRPIDASGGYFDINEVGYYEELPTEENLVFTISVDTAQKSNSKSNRTAFIVVARTTTNKKNVRHFIVDGWAGREPMLNIIDRIGNYVNKYEVSTIYMEDAAMGSQIIENYRTAFACPIIPVIPQRHGAKEFRFDTYAVPMIRGKSILFPKNKAFAKDLLLELTAFPDGELDDYVDTVSQYCLQVHNAKSYGVRKLNISTD
jgi:predicted phage terminase large subunit-like protein